MKYVMLVLSSVSAAIMGVVPVEAHSPQAVRYKLQDYGYSRIRFTDRVLPIYQLNACRGRRHFHLHVNYYGQIVRRETIGWCRDVGRYRRDHVGARSSRFPRYRRYRDQLRYDRDYPPRYSRYR